MAAGSIDSFARDPDPDLRVTHRLCTICEANCGVRVQTRGRRVLRIEGDPEDPFSRGHICPKAHAMLEIQHDPDRLRMPMRRTEAGFEPIGWDEALDWAASRLGEIRDEAGVDSIALYRGNPTSHDAESLLYWNAIQTAVPTRSQFSAGSVDTWPRWVQAGLMYGGFLNTPVPDLDRCDYLLVLGANPVASNGSLMTAPGIKKRLQALRERGGKLVVIDPRRSETARIADEYCSVAPGTDAALLLAMAQVLIAEERVDLDRAAPHIEGLETVRAELARYTPEAVEGACGIDAGTIRRLAREFAAAPRAAAYGRMGTSVQAFGTLTHWAIDLLNILTGNLDREGGVLFPRPAISLAFVGADAAEGPPFGRTQSPVSGYDEIQGEWPAAAFAEEIESERDDRIRALVIIAGNPASSYPNSDRINRALERLEFMVAIDYYINETTRHADLILPPTTPLEHEGYDIALLHFAVQNTAKWSPAALELDPGQMPVWRVLLGLTKRLMGLGALADETVDAILLKQVAERVLPSSPFADRLDAEAVMAALDPEEAGPRRLFDMLLRLGDYGDGFGIEPTGLSIAALEESVHGVVLGDLEPRLPQALATPSGKIDLAPTRILDDLPRLDRMIEERPRDKRMRLIGRRDLRSMNSWLHNFPSLVKGRDRCTLQVAPIDAKRLGLEDGALAQLKTSTGSVLVPVEIDDCMAPGVVSLPHGWGHDLPGVELSVASKLPGVNTNRLLDDSLVDVPSGTSVLGGVPVEITPA